MWPWWVQGSSSLRGLVRQRREPVAPSSPVRPSSILDREWKKITKAEYTSEGDCRGFRRRRRGDVLRSGNRQIGRENNRGETSKERKWKQRVPGDEQDSQRISEMLPLPRRRACSWLVLEAVSHQSLPGAPHPLATSQGAKIHEKPDGTCSSEPASGNATLGDYPQSNSLYHEILELRLPEIAINKTRKGRRNQSDVVRTSHKTKVSRSAIVPMAIVFTTKSSNYGYQI